MAMIWDIHRTFDRVIRCWTGEVKNTEYIVLDMCIIYHEGIVIQM